MSERDEALDLEELSAGDRPLVLPDDLPILPLRDTVLFPNSFMPLAVARESSVRLIDEAISGGKLIGVFTQRDASVEEPQQDDLFNVGTASHIHKMFKLPDGSLRLIVQGLSRLRLDRVTQWWEELDPKQRQVLLDHPAIKINLGATFSAKLSYCEQHLRSWC